MIRLEDIKKFEILVGYGQASFPMEYGSFLYQEVIKDKQKLKLEYLEESAEKVSFVLTGENGEQKGLLTAIKDGGRIHLQIKMWDSTINRFWIRFPVKEKEHFYGCGETFSRFDLRGEKVRIWVAEHQNSKRISKKMAWEEIHGKCPYKTDEFSEYESYYAQPTFISSECYYVHVDGTYFMEFDFTEKRTAGLYLHQNAEITFGSAVSFSQLSGLLSEQLGKQEPLPDWLYNGVILGIQTGSKTVEQKIKSAQKHGVHVAGVWCQDWCGCRHTDFGYQVMWNWEYDKTLYPDLKSEIARWNEKGIRFLGYINPFLSIEKELYEYASEKGYCVKNKNGEDYLVTITTFPAAMVDFTNPEAYNWYKGIIKNNLIGIGMSGWMADFGEYLPSDCVLFNKKDPMEIHNTWPAIWAKMNREAIRECKKEDEIFFFTRAGFTESVKYSMVMWNGDQHVDWSVDNGIPSVIPATLSLAVSGFGITHSDIGGYTTSAQMTRNRELLMRWEEMNVFTPLMRSHEGNQPSRNIQFDADEELLIHLARMTRIHVALKDYLKECVQLNSQKGIPVMRPLFYHYDEPQAYEESYEYLLGRDLLVAPVIREGAAERQCYLPDDSWIHLFTGQKYGGGNVVVEAPIGVPPVFVREKSKWKETLLKKVKGEIEK